MTYSMHYTGIGQMSLEELKRDVSHWIINWVSRYHADLKSPPCPFAYNALLNGSIDWQLAATPIDLKNILSSLPLNGLLNEVVIVGMYRDSIDPLTLHGIVARYNSESLMPAGIVALEDHPDDIEVINGVTMNQGNWVLVLIQRLDALNAASENLRLRGYYDAWSDENLDDVVRWRFAQNP